MILWRISRHISLDGQGGLKCHGRWHNQGRKIVYCAEHPAVALLETLVHGEIDAEDRPLHTTYMEIHAPDTITVERLDLTALPTEWQRSPEKTQALGNFWLESLRTPLLAVPSVITPKTWNYLLNPSHPAAATVTIAEVHKHTRDSRTPIVRKIVNFPAPGALLTGKE